MGEGRLGGYSGAGSKYDAHQDTGDPHNRYTLEPVEMFHQRTNHASYMVGTCTLQMASQAQTWQVCSMFDTLNTMHRSALRGARHVLGMQRHATARQKVQQVTTKNTTQNTTWCWSHGVRAGRGSYCAWGVNGARLHYTQPDNTQYAPRHPLLLGTNLETCGL